MGFAVEWMKDMIWCALFLMEDIFISVIICLTKYMVSLFHICLKRQQRVFGMKCINQENLMMLNLSFGKPNQQKNYTT